MISIVRLHGSIFCLIRVGFTESLMAPLDTKVNDERTKRIERQQNERRAYEETKRREINEKQLEEAKAPAFEREIEDCTTLINYFSRFASGASTVPDPTLSISNADAPAGVPKLELRQVDSDIPEGAVMMTKKAEQKDNSDDFFGGMKGKGKKGKKSSAAAAQADPSAAGSQTINVPFQTVAALLQFNIEVPFSRDDVPKTVEALQKKRTYFEENQVNIKQSRLPIH